MMHQRVRAAVTLISMFAMSTRTALGNQTTSDDNDNLLLPLAREKESGLNTLKSITATNRPTVPPVKKTPSRRTVKKFRSRKGNLNTKHEDTSFEYTGYSLDHPGTNPSKSASSQENKKDISRLGIPIIESKSQDYSENIRDSRGPDDYSEEEESQDYSEIQNEESKNQDTSGISYKESKSQEYIESVKFR